MDTHKIYTPSFSLPQVNRRHTHRSNVRLTPAEVAAQNTKLLTSVFEMERLKRAAEKSLYEFVKQAWHIVEPGVEFSEGWHIKVICEHLEAVTDRRIKNLIINIPPRHSKSTISTVMWPVWSWIKNPSEKFLTASYSGSLSIRDAVKSRRLLESPWFIARWPTLMLNRDQNTKQRYENEDTGYRIAASVGGTTTGEGGSILLCVHGDTVLESSLGHKTIKEIVDLRLPVAVAGYDHSTGEKVFEDVVRYDKNPGKRMLKITSKSGRSIVVTEDHPIFIVGRGYIAASEVKQHDRLLCSVQQGVEPKTKSRCQSCNNGLQCDMSPCTNSESSGDDTLCSLRDGGSTDASTSSTKRNGYLLFKKVLRCITDWFK